VAASATGGLGQRFFKTKPRAVDRHANFERPYPRKSPKSQANRSSKRGENGIMDPFILTTERLILRPWHDADRDPFFALNSEPAVYRHLGPLTREQSDAMIDRANEQFETTGWGRWALEERASGLLIGHCGFMPVTGNLPFAPGVEIGWRLSERWQGKGFAREAAEEAMRAGFDIFGFDPILAYTTPANTASWGLMERLGMTRVGPFDHPKLPEGNRLRSHLLYEKRR
jgi:RimJ/RimL family protein N-acetyltransferase